MNKLTRILAALLVCAAVVLAAFAWWLGSRPTAPSAPAALPAASGAANTAPPEYPVVVALRALEAGKPIPADALQVMKLPMNPPGAIRDIGDVAGKITSTHIEEGAPLTERMINRSLAMQLGKGERAVAVPVDEVAGAGNRVEPGDYVDVFFTLKQSADVDKTQSRLLAARLRVLTYGAATVDGVAPATPSSNAPTRAQSAVLAVPVEDVSRIVLAAQSGKLLLAPRHPEDERAPDLALFPAPAPALQAKAGLTRQQIEELKSAENKAYAGLELTALAGSDGATRTRAKAATATARKSSSNATASLEVVRGSKRETVAY